MTGPFPVRRELPGNGLHLPAAAAAPRRCLEQRPPICPSVGPAPVVCKRHDRAWICSMQGAGLGPAGASMPAACPQLLSTARQLLILLPPCRARGCLCYVADGSSDAVVQHRACSVSGDGTFSPSIAPPCCPAHPQILPQLRTCLPHHPPILPSPPPNTAATKPTPLPHRPDPICIPEKTGLTRYCSQQHSSHLFPIALQMRGLVFRQMQGLPYK